MNSHLIGQPFSSSPTQMVSAQNCRKGWTYHSGYCYFLSTERKSSWSTAIRACRER